MYNWDEAKVSALAFWEGRDLDKPYYVNGFNGTWSFSDHDLIPDSLRDFIVESFHGYPRFKRIPLEDINTLMNEVWEGPGSMTKIVTLTYDMRNARQMSKDSLDDPLKGYKSPTIDSELADEDLEISVDTDEE